MRPAPGQMEQRLLDLVEEQARQKQLPAHKVAEVREQMRDSVHALSVRTGKPVETAARQALERLQERSRPRAERRLEETFRKLEPEEQCRRYFTDRNTGLFNLRGLEALPPPVGRPMLAEWDIEATKFLNDQHGHEALDGVLRAAARALAREIPDGAKIGGSLRGYVRDQGEANRIAAAIEKALDPKGHIRVTAAVAPREATVQRTIDETAKAHDEVKKLERATGRLGYRLGGPVAFMRGAPPIAFEAGMDGVDPKSPQAKTFFAKVADQTEPLVARLAPTRAVESMPLAPAHKALFASLAPREQAEAIFVEPSTGLLTEQGMRALPERKWKASVDMRALRHIDQTLGHDDANKVIAGFGRAVARAVAEHGNCEAAHLHGDEYMLQADSLKKLTGILQTVEWYAEKLGYYKQLPDRQVVTVEGVQFAWGVGKTYDYADRKDLVRRKEQLPEARKPTLVEAARADRTLEDLRGRSVDVRTALPPRTEGLSLSGLSSTPALPPQIAADPRQRLSGPER